MCCVVEVFCQTILDHYSDHFSIVLRGRQVWWCTLYLWFLVRACGLFNWSLISPRLLWDGFWGGLMHSLGLFWMFVGLFLPLLGSCLLQPFDCWSWFVLAHPWFLGHWFLRRLCFLLHCLSFCGSFWYFLVNVWDLPFSKPFANDHVYITFCNAVAHR